MEQIDLERIKIDKEYFKKVMLSEIAKYKEENKNFGLCYIYQTLFPYVIYIITEVPFLTMPSGIPKYGYDDDGEEIVNCPYVGFWWPCDMKGSSEDWYAPRIEYIKNLYTAEKFEKFLSILRYLLTYNKKVKTFIS